MMSLKGRSPVEPDIWYSFNISVKATYIKLKFNLSARDSFILYRFALINTKICQILKKKLSSFFPKIVDMKFS